MEIKNSCSIQEEISLDKNRLVDVRINFLPFRNCVPSE